ncbi:methyltransferase domain-containing protein [Halopseudomonas salegens]|uniref:tRNA 5-carboxymethoxyuridine methyltransferase n=1 Tax=Halopseudomonas salegens TaxID=1434072 RepID=A0A1H2GH54_9GAMM|nr:methyltransferase domain-containing protein [Halopseudomonas salegens]SDU18874.1 S-adenosylmethionine-dependent methyltransferase [Halopseudomonas salegens]
MNDRYFDQLGSHLARKIYAGPKGAIRLAVLTRDLQEWLPAADSTALEVLDVGAGLGHISAWLAERGHDVTVSEPSPEMLSAARERLDNAGTPAGAYWPLPLQDLPAQGQQFDLVICHAVLEWLADPQSALAHLRSLLKTGGMLSLAFYNRDALIYRNLIKGQFRKLERQQLAGVGQRGLTPQQPVDPRELAHWASNAGLTREHESGIRVFYDYMPPHWQKLAEEDDVIREELAYSRHPAYAPLGRYLHWWLRRD